MAVSRSISVIIPTFNRKILLAETLDNILSQSFAPHEVIVVDDHSTDGSIDFLKNNYGNRIIVVSNQGKGPGAARNTGMRLATGDFIKFFDSDDLMTANTLKVQHEVLSESGKGFVYSPYFFAFRDQEKGWRPKDDLVLSYFPLNGSLPLWHYMMVDGLFITIPGMLFKKTFLEEVGSWREDVVAYEDWDFLFRTSLLEPFPQHTNACAFLYRLHGDQTTVKHYSDSQRDRDKNEVLKDLYEDLIRDDGKFSWTEKLFFCNKFYQLYHGGKLHESLQRELRHYDSTLQKFVWAVLRGKLRYGRWRTQTDWQPCHGLLRSKKQISLYLSFIN